MGLSLTYPEQQPVRRNCRNHSAQAECLLHFSFTAFCRGTAHTARCTKHATVVTNGLIAASLLKAGTASCMAGRHEAYVCLSACVVRQKLLQTIRQRTQQLAGQAASQPTPELAMACAAALALPPSRPDVACAAACALADEPPEPLLPAWAPAPACAPLPLCSSSRPAVQALHFRLGS